MMKFSDNLPPDLNNEFGVYLQEDHMEPLPQVPTMRQYYATHCPINYSDMVKIAGYAIYSDMNPTSCHSRKEFFKIWARLRFEYADAMMDDEGE